jgi:hypothetical protein
MKPSELKKDQQTSVRINTRVKKVLKAKGKSPQKIVDEFIDKSVKIDKDLNLK